MVDLLSFLRASPDFLIIGQGRAGTTTLFDYLCEHPDVVKPSKKEIGWLGNKSLRWYKSHFPLKSKKLTGEATPYYYISKNSPRIFRYYFPKLKVISIIRNQNDRAFSHYSMNIEAKIEDKTFDEALKLEKKRMSESGAKYFIYSYMASGSLKPLKNWKQYFPNMLVLKFEDIKENPTEIQQRLCEHLGLKYNKISFKRLSLVPKVNKQGKRI